jgi:hypothetical protein
MNIGGGYGAIGNNVWVSNYVVIQLYFVFFGSVLYII